MGGGREVLYFFRRFRPEWTMALGFVSDRFGRSRAEGIAEQLEYVWNDDCTRDVFARK